MKRIEISEEVWQEIANLGKFGETEEDVLRRVFNLPDTGNIKEYRAITGPRIRRRKIATKSLSSNVINNKLELTFEDGVSSSWDLPSKFDKFKIREVRDEACGFARSNGATSGQIAAVKKALNESGYYLTK